MHALTWSSKHERLGHSRSLSFPSVCVWQRNELTTSHRGDPPTRLGCLRSRQREMRRLIITFRLTNVIPEWIIFVSRGITVYTWKIAEATGRNSSPLSTIEVQTVKYPLIDICFYYQNEYITLNTMHSFIIYVLAICISHHQVELH